MERTDSPTDMSQQDPPDPTDQGLIRELEKLDLGPKRLLCVGSAADVFLCSAKVVKKVMRVSPGHFNNGDIEQGEDILLDYRRHFRDRIQEWSRLTSPCLVGLFASSGTELSFCQEYCDQGDLRNYIKHSVGSRHICYHIIQDILDGLIYLHHHDPPITHGNLNPGKIFVTSDGRMKIGEFGLAASTVKFSHLVPAISFNGLVRWMSPERLQLEAEGQDGSASTQSDVWSLGCTIFEIVTGQLPYSKYKHDAKVTQRIMKGEPPGNLEQMILSGKANKDISRGESNTESLCTRFLQDIIKQCWETPQNRPSCRGLQGQLNHNSSNHNLHRLLGHDHIAPTPSVTLIERGGEYDETTSQVGASSSVKMQYRENKRVLLSTSAPPSEAMFSVEESTLSRNTKLFSDANDLEVATVTSYEVTPRVEYDHQILPITQRETNVKLCPAPTTGFIGRQKILEQVGSCITRGDRERCVFVLHGLGGAGKTQVALRAVGHTKDLWTNVVYVDATSRETVIGALEAFAQDKTIGGTYEDALRWLESRRERWLMVFDNADDPSLNIANFFPGGSHGSILITTRLQSMRLLGRGPDSFCEVSNMDPEEALKLLLEAAQLQDYPLPDYEYNAATELVKSLGHLALAITLAGACIRHSGQGISEYLKLYTEQAKATHEAPSAPSDYERTVYLIWALSYGQISAHAQQLLWLLAFFHREGITEKTFYRAATNVLTYESTMPSPSSEETRHYIVEYLRAFSDPLNSWDSDTFLAVLTELVSHSLIQHDHANDTYTMHVLVQSWVRSILPIPFDVATARTSFLLALSVGFDDTTADRAFYRGLEPHIGRILEEQPMPDANDAIQFAKVYGSLGRWGPKEKLEVVVLDSKSKAYGDQHPDTLASMNNLAHTYLNQGRYRQAEALLLQVIAADERPLGEEHPNTLASMGNLADTYVKLGRYKEAEVLLSRTVSSYKRMAGDEHPNTLASMGSLANTYLGQGRYKLAEALLCRVVDACKQVLGETHPGTLAIMSSLADTYLKRGRYEEAETLLCQVVVTYKRLLGEEHPNTLASMGSLADTYLKQGRYTEAEALLLQVVGAYRRTLGENHPDTLASMGSLADTYLKRGRYSKAETLLCQVVVTYKRLLGEEHPYTLANMGSLANTYLEQGRYTEAEALLLHVMDAYKRALGENHPDTLASEDSLADTYLKQGRYEEAEALLLQVVDVYKPVLGDRHPRTLASIHRLDYVHRLHHRHSKPSGTRWAIYQRDPRQLPLEALNHWEVQARAKVDWEVVSHRTRDNTIVHTATPLGKYMLQV